MDRKDYKFVALRFTSDQYSRIEQAAESDLLPVNRYCMRAVLASVLKSDVITVNRDRTGKFAKRES